MKEHNQNIQPEDAAPVRLPIYLRWPVIVICLFIWAPVSTIVGAILWIWRLVFNHSHPQFRLKRVTKLMLTICCVGIVVWAATTDSSTTEPAGTLPAVEAGSSDQQKSFEKIEKSLQKEETYKAAKALAKVDEPSVYVYYQKLLTDLLNEQDTDQIARSLSIYQAAFPDTELMQGVLEANARIEEIKSQMEAIDDKYHGSVQGSINAVNKTEQRAFYVQYHLQSSAANSDNEIISAIGELVDSANVQASDTYEYFANNVENNFVLALAMGYWDTNVYAGDENYVLVTDEPFPQAGATNLYVYQIGTSTLTNNRGFEQEVPRYRVMDESEMETIRTDYDSYTMLSSEADSLYESMKAQLA